MVDLDLDNRSTISTDKLLKIIEFVKPRGLKLCKIIVKNSKNNAYDCGYYYGNHEKTYIICRFGHHKMFPYSFQFRKDKSEKKGYYSGIYNFPSKTHAVLYSLAHEIRHHYQHCHPKKKYWLYVSPARQAETDADNFALKKLNEFNKLRENGIDIFK
jgi:hypothetical protein